MIQHTTNEYMVESKNMAIIISAIIAVIGWLVSSYINNRAFKRAETSKLKDKVASLMEGFFDNLEEKIKSRNLKETDLDDFIGGRMSIIELHISHLNKKIKIKLISDEQIKKIRDEPYDYLESPNGNYKNNLNDLKFGTLEMIEENYTDWYFKNNNPLSYKIKGISKK
ncbi:TPA: hypothetical protein ACOQZT_002163 [Serratia odorifera]